MRGKINDRRRNFFYWEQEKEDLKESAYVAKNCFSITEGNRSKDKQRKSLMRGKINDGRNTELKFSVTGKKKN